MRLIDADALQRRICGARCGCEYEDCGNEGVCLFDHFISHAPTVDAEPVKHGEWAYYYEGVWYCSACHADFVFDQYGDIHPKADCGYNYCPNCGAEMGGKQEEER